MGTAINCIDRVRKRINRFGISIGILDGSFDANILNILFHMHNGMQIFTVTIQVTDERSESAFKVEGHLTISAFIHELDPDTARNKRHFTKTLKECIETIINVFREDLLVELEGLFGASFVLDLPDLFNGALRNTAMIALLPPFSIAFDVGLHPLGEGVHSTQTNSMQTTGNLIATTTKFAACTDHGHGHIHSFHGISPSISFGGVWTYRDPAAVIFNGYAAIRMDGDTDLRTIASQCFINCIVNDLIDKMMQSLDVRTTHIHTGAFTHMLNAFERLN